MCSESIFSTSILNNFYLLWGQMMDGLRHTMKCWIYWCQNLFVFCIFRLVYPGSNFDQFVCKPYGEGKTSRPAHAQQTSLQCCQIVFGGGRFEAGLTYPACCSVACPLINQPITCQLRPSTLYLWRSWTLPTDFYVDQWSTSFATYASHCTV